MATRLRCSSSAVPTLEAAPKLHAPKDPILIAKKDPLPLAVDDVGPAGLTSPQIRFLELEDLERAGNDFVLPSLARDTQQLVVDVLDQEVALPSARFAVTRNPFDIQPGVVRYCSCDLHP